MNRQPGPITDEILDRNWDELLQELRVTQTGVQILTAFLLTVPFTARFGMLSDFQRDVFLAVLCGSIITTGFVVAPAAFHRVLFRQGMRRWLVETANICARISLVTLALTCSGALFLVFDVVTTRSVATVAFGISIAFFLALWLLAPAFAGYRDRAAPDRWGDGRADPDSRKPRVSSNDGAGTRHEQATATASGHDEGAGHERNPHRR